MKIARLAAAFAAALFLCAAPAWAQEAASETTAATQAAVDAPAPETVAPVAEAQAAADTEAAQDMPAGVTEPVYTATCEAGFSLAEGNSSNRVLASGCGASRQGEAWLIGFTGKLRFGQTRFGGPDYPGGPADSRGDFILTENNWDAALREERSLTASKSQYVFLVQGAAGDQFKGFWTRYDAQAGYGYAFLNSPDTQLKLEAGAQYNRDYLVNPNVDGDKTEDRLGGVLTLLAEKRLNDAVMGAARVSYMPNFEDPGSDYRVLGEVSLTARLMQRLSFKSAVGLAYDNEPPLVTPLDKTGTKLEGVVDVPARKTDVTWNNLLVVTIF